MRKTIIPCKNDNDSGSNMTTTAATTTTTTTSITTTADLEVSAVVKENEGMCL